jgi:hypothetical protein
MARDPTDHKISGHEGAAVSGWGYWGVHWDILHLLAEKMTAVQAIRFAGVLVITFIVLGTFGMLAFLAGPQIEAAVFPVIKAEHVAGSVRWTEKEICWSVHYSKFRNDAPAYFNYRVHFSNTNERIPLAVYRISETGKRQYLSTYGFANHHAGMEWVADYCADLPADVIINRPFLVEGEGFYDTPHHLWLVPQDLPDFIVDQDRVPSPQRLPVSPRQSYEPRRGAPFQGHDQR